MPFLKVASHRVQGPARSRSRERASEREANFLRVYNGCNSHDPADLLSLDAAVVPRRCMNVGSCVKREVGIVPQNLANAK